MSRPKTQEPGRRPQLLPLRCLTVSNLATISAVAVAVTAVAVGARAASPSEIAVARRLYDQARKLETKRDWEQAAAKLEQAIAIKDTPGLRYHLAYCEQHAGHWVRALDDYDRARELIQGGVRAPLVERLVGPARDALRKRVPTLTVKLPEDVTNATLELDGKRVPTALIGQPTPLNTGQHTVRVSAPGRQPFAVSLTLKESETRVVNAELRAPPPPPPNSAQAPAAALAPAPAEKPAASSARTIALIAEGAVTLAGLGVGIGYTLAASSADSRATDARNVIDRASGGSPGACSAPQPTTESACADLQSAVSDRDRDRTVATVGFVSAGVGAAAAVATWFLWRPAHRSQNVGWAVTPLESGAYCSARGTF